MLASRAFENESGLTLPSGREIIGMTASSGMRGHPTPGVKSPEIFSQCHAFCAPLEEQSRLTKRVWGLHGGRS